MLANSQNKFLAASKIITVGHIEININQVEGDFFGMKLNFPKIELSSLVDIGNYFSIAFFRKETE
jgi:hypothetical protein